MKLTYLVNMSAPDCLPSYDAHEFTDLREAATTAIDVVEAMMPHYLPGDAREMDFMIDVENGKVDWTSTNRINVAMIGEHETLIVFIQPVLTPEMC